MNRSKKSQPLNLTPSGHTSVPRNSFDMGYHSVFTSPAGLILPTYVQDVQPDDYLDLKVGNFTRTMPVNTAAFSRYKECTDFYFVPYRLLWRWYDQLYTGVSDYSTTSAPFDPAVANPQHTIPYIQPSAILQMLQTDAKDIHGMPIKYWTERMLDLLGYGVSNDSAVSTEDYYYKLSKLTPIQPNFNPFRLLAFQRIYADFYRNSDYEKNDPWSYNIDGLAENRYIGDPYLTKMFTPRYIQWKKDRLTSVKPTPLSAGTSIDQTSYPKNEGQSSTNNAINEDTDFIQFQTTLAGFVNNQSNPEFSIQSLRSAMALDRLSRLTMLTPKRYKDQIKTHFGVQPDNSDYYSPRYLGSFEENVVIGEITATSSGSDSESSNVLGQIAGKGICAGHTNRPITAHFNEPGIVLGMHYIQPLSEYDSNRIDDFNRKFSRSDYYTPEYDNLGLQPIIGSTVGIKVAAPLINELNSNSGYQARYCEYKTRLDEVHGLLQSKKSLSPWVSPRSMTLTQQGYISTADLYVNPKITDTLFALKYDGKQEADAFICHFRYDATLVRNMSTLGLPTL